MSSDRALYEVSGQWKAADIKGKTAELLAASKSDIEKILVSHGMQEEDACRAAGVIAPESIQVDFTGRGSVGEVVAVAVSLAPLIKVLVALLQPFSNRASDLAFEIGKDIWEMTKKKLWYDYQIKLTSADKSVR